MFKTEFTAGDTTIHLASVGIIGTLPQEHIDLREGLEAVVGHLQEGRAELLAGLRESGNQGEALYAEIAGSLNGKFGLIVDYAGSPNQEPQDATQVAARALIRTSADLSEACREVPDWDVIAQKTDSLHSDASALLQEMQPVFERFGQYRRVDPVAVDPEVDQQMWFLEMPKV